jgi:Protein of unknown function (DUF2844)
VPLQFFTFDPRKFAVFAALMAAALAPSISAAALGEPESSIQGDVAKLQGAVNSTERLTYRVHEISLPSGTVVREFVAQSGAIFAVAWHGPTMPNLRQALGKYFDNYVATAKATPLHHRRLDISQSDLVVHAAGHMRAFSGIAYLPQALPSGVSVGELQ